MSVKRRHFILACFFSIFLLFPITQAFAANPIPLPLAANWSNYNGGYAQASVLKEGNIVTVNGLIRGTSWGHLATLPAGYRPKARLIFHLNNHTYSSRVDVLPNGQILWMAGGKSHSWISLSGITFMVVQGRGVSLARGWRHYGNSYDAGRYYKTSNIVVVSGVVTSPRKQRGLIATLPVGHRPRGILIFNLDQRKSNSGQTGISVRVNVLPNGQIIWDPGSTTHPTQPNIEGWISLSGIVFSTTGGSALNPINGWTNYGSGYDAIRATRYGNMVFLTGLVKRASSTNTPIALLPATLRPKRRLIFGVNTQARISRLDVLSTGYFHRHAGPNIKWISLSGSTIILGSSLADLRMNYFRLSATSVAGAGTRTTASFRVHNYGGTNAGTFYVRFYYGDSNSTSGLTTVYSSYRISSLNRSASTAILKAGFTIPNNVLYGSRRIHWYIDYTRRIPESNESNNRSYGGINITGKPDLRFVSFSRTPSTVRQGGRVTLNYRVYNYGYSRLPTYADVRLYFSNDGTINNSDSALYTRRIPSLNARSYAWGTSSHQVVQVTIPSNAGTGSRYVGGYADYSGRVSEVSESNNSTRAGITITSSKADLRLYSWTTNTSTVLGYTSKMTITIRVYNQGYGNAGRFYVSFYYGNTTSTSGTTYIGRYYFSGGLAARKVSGYVKATVTFPSSVIYGKRYIHSYVDYAGQVSESNESNNRNYRAFNITGKPDLQVNYLHRSPSSQAPGGSVRISIRFYNAGYSRLATTAYGRLYYSHDSTIRTSDVYLSRQYNLLLNARSQTSVFGTTVTLPTNAQQGTRYLGAYADYSGKVSETLETNNTHRVSISVVSSRPELRMYSWSINTRSLRGSTSKVTASFRVRNDGNANAGLFYVAFYYGNSTSTSGLTFLGNYAISRLNRISTSTTYKRVLTLPSSVYYGRRYIHYFVDYTNRIGETKETNNRGNTYINITGRPNLQVNYVLVRPTTQIPSGRVTVSIRVYNAGYSRTATYMDTRIFFSNDATITTSDTYLGQYYRLSALNARTQSSVISRVITLPSNAAAGSRYIGAYADASGRIVETSETDNAKSARITVLSGTPDLYMYSFSPKTRSVPGYTSRITITKRIRNRGSGNAGAFYVAVYYGRSTSTSGLVYLNRYRFSSLNRNTTSGNVVIVVTLPNSVVYGTGYLHWFVDYTGTVKESSETNNRSYTSISITSRPNLRVSYIKITPTTQSPGGRVVLSHRITNYGYSQIPSYFDSPIYYSHDSSITTRDARLYIRRTSSLKARATVSYNQTLTVPTNAVPGSRYMGILVDYNGRVSESSENDNIGAVRFTVGGKPDLKMYSFSVTSSARGFGSRITVVWRVRNYGPVNAGAFYVSMYYGNSTGTSGLTYLGRVRLSSLGRLVTSGTYKTALTLPNVVVYGSRYIHYHVDYSRAVSESNENNNRSYGKISITGKPDLQVSYLAALPTTQVQGGAFRLSYRIFNAGYSQTAATSYTRFYYSTDGTIQTSDTYLSRQVTIGTLKARSYSPGSSNGGFTAYLPTGARTGTGYIGAITDYNSRVSETSESNNTRFAKITVSSASPDLTVYSYTSTVVARGAGSRVVATLRVRNIGVTNAGRFDIGFYYGDSKSASRLTLLGSISVASLAKGAVSGNLVKTFTLPGNVAYGTRYLHYFIDYKNKIGEKNEKNNRGYRALGITGRPNLMVSVLSGTPSTLAPGGRATLYYRIFNAGYSRITTYTYARFYYSNDATIRTSDTYLGLTVRVSSLNGRKYYPGSGNGRLLATIPSRAIAGTRYIGAFIDYSGRIRETSESDNTRAWKFTVSGKADLVMSTWTSSSSSTGRGSSVSVGFKIRNNGNANAGAFTLGIYYGDKTSASGLTLLKRVAFSTGLKAQTTSGTALASFSLPGNVLFGKRYLHYYIDDQKKVAESNENNNRGYRTLSITGRPNLIVSAIGASPTTQSPKGTVVVQYRLQNTGLSRISGSFFTRFYFSKDAAITTGDAYLGAEVRVSGLDAGSSYPKSTSGTVSVKIPVNALAGTSYIGAYTDYNTQHTETSESDNTKAIKITVAGNPDLVAVSVSITPGTQQAGKTVSASYKITNSGIKNAGPFTVNIYYSKTSSIANANLKLDSFTVQSLRVGQSLTSSRTITLPSSLSAGNAYIGIFVDPTNKMSEVKENNNTASTRITVLVDQDKDGYTNDKDCNDNDNQIYPGAKELCDGKDNNCNKKIDENCSCQTGTRRDCFSAGTGCTKGTNGKYTCKTPCKTGVQTCKAGKWDACTGEVTPKAEICDGKDNNCDGNIDEALSRKCYTGDKATQNVGVCKEGSQECVGGKWASCKGEVKPSVETCNGKDDDCDGKLDNIKGKTDSLTQSCYTGPQGTDRKGECKAGKKTCSAGKWGACQGEVTPQKELCDGKDNSCDGKIDGKLSRSCYSGPQGTDGTGVCKAGSQACKAGKWSTCAGEVKPEIEVCDGKDNNCDGKIDENVNRSCYSGPKGTDGVGACKAGKQSCSAGKWDTCKSEVTPKTEICDGKDNDCDGKLDNKTGTSDSLEKNCSNACSQGTETCTAGKWKNCTAQSCGEGSGETTGENTGENAGEVPNTEVSSDAGLPESTTEGSNPDKTDCYTKSCTAGQICQNSQCVPDPCDGVSCKTGEFCRAGNCIKTCGCTNCKSGEKCVDGSCQVDSCASTSCSSTEVCDPNSGQCVTDHCSSVTCGKGRTCEKGKCIDDQCANITCSTGNECKAGQCVGKSCSNEKQGEVVTEGEPTTTEGEPTTTEGEPTTTEGEPTTTEGEPTTTEGESTTTDGGEPTTTDGGEATADGDEPTTTDGGEATADGTSGDKANPEKGTDKTGATEVLGDGGAEKIISESGNPTEQAAGDDGSSVGGGCGCTATDGSRSPIALFFLFLFVLVPFFRRKRN